MSTINDSIKYRPDIDGLRAVAVLAVVLFHAFPEWVPGGFIGVDIFFVISGFLISTILFESLSAGSFSFINFYSRRIRRIFPALITVLLVSLALGWCILVAREYQQLGKHVFGGASFLSNFVLWKESGYFDNTSDTKPLLHLWSLGIEEQFYIFWPLILWAAWWVKSRLAQPYLWLWVVGVIAIGSFWLNVDEIKLDRVAAFYSPLTRFWELLIGALLAYFVLYTPKFFKLIPSNWLSWAGVVLILLGISLINKDSFFPGYWALLPTLGAACLIGSGSHGGRPWFNQQVLSNRILVWFGLISFPLYLWHWPLLSLARILNSEVAPFLARGIIVALAILLSWLTYQYIEKPFRYGSNGKMKTIILLVLMIAIAGAGINIKLREGLPFRVANKINIDPLSGNDGVAGVDLNEECGLGSVDKSWFKTCLQDSRQPLKYALIGDSHAEAIFRGLVRTSTTNGRWLFIGGPGGKFPVTTLISSDPIYARFLPASPLAINAIAQNSKIEAVLFVAATRNLFNLKETEFLEDLEASPYFEVALEAVQNAINPLKAAGKKVVLLVDNPTLAFPEDCVQRQSSLAALNWIFPKKLNARCSLTYERHLKMTQKYSELLRVLAKRNPGVVTVFDTTDILCDVTKGVCGMSKNDRLLYSYSDHISDYAAGLIGKELNGYLAQLLKK
ncbi:acyltransferase family protein [Polynucleobacter sp. IMCC 30228]|uniref:acyltransferase family protein n=1 Tax=Polynucleobacter sp. IMCC 30228 TaxID=2781011 RepID=UPI001F2193B2|nr:acyltransferase family protein [Polynucleobacter sp. IMCC 30228]MCE7527921.1 acyltransferase [Polynucleobacter sp. IMCC 30228]